MTDRARPMIGYGRQSIDERDIDAVVQVLRGEMITQGPAIERFERAVAERTGARHAVAVNSGTAGLHIACLTAREAAGWPEGTPGVTSSVTFAASVNSQVLAGLAPAVTDIAPDVLAMTPDLLRRHLAAAPETALVMPVLFAGLAWDAAALRETAGDRILVEDAAHAFGALYQDGSPVGSCRYADMTVFSFHPVKPITTGEGGMVTTNDDELARLLRLFRNHGLERDPARFTDPAAGTEDGQARYWYYEQQVMGLNYRLTDIQAALGLSQLARLDSFRDRRREIALRYDAAFAGLPHLTVPQAAPDMRLRSGHHLYCVEIDFAALGTTRQAFMTALRAQGIAGQVHYIPVYRHPVHAARLGGPASFPGAEAYYARCLSLPLFPGLSDADAAHVVAAVSDLVTRGGGA